MGDSFATLLRAFRDERSLTQEELADKAGITVKAVGALERGERRRPYPHTVRALADALNLDAGHRARLIGAVPDRTRTVAGPSSAPQVDAAAPTVLPSATVDLVGRSTALESLTELLTEATTRVVTLTGPGGVGKSALALAAARAASHAFPGGVTLVELAGITEPEVVIPVIAAALGVPEAGHRGTVVGLSPFLAGRRMLLLLDNLEQVLAAAPSLADLSAHCPGLVILGTSRAPLRIRAERTLRVEPLDQGACVRLFRERADAAGGRLTRSADEDEAVAEICRRLDGLPLAVELAAAATALLRPAELLARLDSVLIDGPRDLPERQRSMAATLDWSYDLLGERERALLARLAVLPGTFSLAGAEAVAGQDVLRELRVLLDHSLVSRGADVQGTERFRLLRPVRQYAALRLAPADRAVATGRLADCVLALARDLEADLRGAALVAGLDLAEADLPAIRAGLMHLIEAGRLDDAAEAIWRLWPFLALRGVGQEGLALVALLRRGPMTDVVKAQLLVAAAGMSYVLGEIPALRADADAALALAQRLDRPGLLAEAAVLAGSGALFAGDLDEASARLAVVRTRAADDDETWAVLHCRIAHAQVALLAGSLHESEQLLLGCEHSARGLGNPFTLATVLNLRATLTQLRDEHSETARLLAESAEISMTARISWTFAYTLPALASVAVRSGDHELGATLFGAAASWSADHAVDAGFPASEALAHHDLALAREALGEVRFRPAWDAGRDTTAPEVVELARELSRRARG
ncbi:helix-turn-helix domain-containing protein [Cellulomonas sp. URHE0023]|uniref:ATP-binding protein n=1 Tax=Cellulomonas sp. URHE0023 TaxID=1380354 RepID=UPI00068E6040|nr:helix-turn-helix domain-containing protein [Cellulomonas sp. URHE0023]